MYKKPEECITTHSLKAEAKNKRIKDVGKILGIMAIVLRLLMQALKK